MLMIVSIVLMPANAKLAIEQKYGQWTNRVEANLVNNKTKAI